MFDVNLLYDLLYIFGVTECSKSREFDVTIYLLLFVAGTTGMCNLCCNFIFIIHITNIRK